MGGQGTTGFEPRPVEAIGFPPARVPDDFFSPTAAKRPRIGIDVWAAKGTFRAPCARERGKELALPFRGFAW
jgi:hypothetical protein